MLLLLAGNADFMFDPPGWVDTYGLLGRFWHYPEQNPLFEEYKNSRLPWILPGFVIHRLFDTVTASYILHTTVLLTSSVALYLLLRDALQDRRSAAIAAAAWSCYTWIHGDGGWDYHILAACAYYLLSLWMTVRSSTASEMRARLWAIGAGAAFACAVHTHLVFAAFVPFVIAVAAVAVSGDSTARFRSVAATVAFAVAGGLAVTVLLGAINAATGGRWLFFVPQIEFALLLSEGNRWTREPAVWLPEAGHLVIPFWVVVAGVVWLIRRSHADLAKSTHLTTTFVVLGLLSALLTGSLQFIAHQTVLDPTYGAYPLYCHVFIMLGALLRPRQDPAGSWYPAVAVASPLVYVAPLLFLLPWKLPGYAAVLVQQLQLPSTLVLLPPLALGGLVLFMLWALKGTPRLALFAVSFGLLNAWLTFSATSYGIATPGVNRDTLIVIRSLDRFVSSLDPSLFAIRFWREPGIVQGPYQPLDLNLVFNSFLSTRRRSLVTAAYDRPNISAGELTDDDLYTQRCVGVLSSKSAHGAVVARIRNRLGELNLPVVEVGHHEVTSGPISVALTVLSLRDDDRPPDRDRVACPPAS